MTNGRGAGLEDDAMTKASVRHQGPIFAVFEEEIDSPSRQQAQLQVSAEAG
jgi:hypothetical protein